MSDAAILDQIHTEDGVVVTGYVPVHVELIADSAFHLDTFISDAAKAAVEVSCCVRFGHVKASAFDYTLLDIQGPLDYRHVPGDLEPHCRCFRGRVRVTARGM